VDTAAISPVSDCLLVLVLVLVLAKLLLQQRHHFGYVRAPITLAPTLFSGGVTKPVESY
jgi:hypothetical protein